MRASLQRTVRVRLDASEEFQFETRTGLISVQSLRFDPGDFEFPVPERKMERYAWADGTAILKDGRRGQVNRSDMIPFYRIPRRILKEVVDTFNNADEVKL